MKLTYSGDLLQTIVFPDNKVDITKNFKATDRFIGALGSSVDLNQQLFQPKSNSNSNDQRAEREGGDYCQ
jgi:hypothetical protein